MGNYFSFFVSIYPHLKKIRWKISWKPNQLYGITNVLSWKLRQRSLNWINWYTKMTVFISNMFPIEYIKICNYTAHSVVFAEGLPHAVSNYVSEKISNQCHMWQCVWFINNFPQTQHATVFLCRLEWNFFWDDNNGHMQLIQLSCSNTVTYSRYQIVLPINHWLN